MTQRVSTRRLAACWAVHFYTASGAVAAFAALHAIFAHDVATAFWWLYVAVAVDGSDGVLARAADVKGHLPQFDGAKLDDPTRSPPRTTSTSCCRRVARWAAASTSNATTPRRC